MSNRPPEEVELLDLLDELDPSDGAVERHLWLIDLMDWLRGDSAQVSQSVDRMHLLLVTLQARPRCAQRLREWWHKLLHEIDASMLLADFGFASHSAFLKEVFHRLHIKLLPTTPETVDAAELFALAIHTPHDAQWIIALPDETLAILAQLLRTSDDECHDRYQNKPLTHWQCTLLDAITFCTSQVRAAGFSPEIRSRTSPLDQSEYPFHGLAACFDDLCNAWLNNEHVDEAAQAFKLQLESCRQHAATVYVHLDKHGISVDLVFRLRQLRERILRIRTLLDCLISNQPDKGCQRLISQLATVAQERTSIGHLFKVNASLLAAKVSQRSSIAGEQYITRTPAEYRSMLSKAAGGGLLTALTTALKFAVMALGLSALWFGFWSGVVYAVSFVVIQLLHFTLATKQPAMTAPAMAAKLKNLDEVGGIEGFVEEVSYLVRSQVAAVLGNVVAVFPMVIVLSAGLLFATGHPMIDAETALYVLSSLSVLGPSLLFAAFTGVLLFGSSIVAGWAENWFVFHRLDSILRYNPRITQTLGAKRAHALAHFMGQNISGFASNISLGLALGLVPAFMGFWGLPLEVRHVTLSTGQLGAACASLGWDIVKQTDFWLALVCLPLIGMLNVGVSFYLAFRIAVQAQSIEGPGRTLLGGALRRRLLNQPGSFLWPQKNEPVRAFGSP